MKTRLYLTLAMLLVVSACDSPGDSNTPEEQEVINMVRVTLVDSANVQDTSVLHFVDADGPAGSDQPVITGDTLRQGRTYIGRTELFRVIRGMADSLIHMDQEIIDAGTSHQFFYVAEEQLPIDIDYTDQDVNGNPIGLTFKLHISSIAPKGEHILNVLLMHFDDPLQKDGVNPGGESDVDIEFPITID